MYNKKFSNIILYGGLLILIIVTVWSFLVLSGMRFYIKEMVIGTIILPIIIGIGYLGVNTKKVKTNSRNINSYLRYSVGLLLNLLLILFIGRKYLSINTTIFIIISFVIVVFLYSTFYIIFSKIIKKKI